MDAYELSCRRGPQIGELILPKSSPDVTAELTLAENLVATFFAEHRKGANATAAAWLACHASFGYWRPDHGKSYPVPALTAHRLHDSPAQSRLLCDHLQEPLNALYHRIGTVWVGYFPIPHDIVADDYRPYARQFQCPVQVIRQLGLIGVDEDKVERCFMRQSRKQIKRQTDPYIDNVRKTCARNISLCDLSVAWFGLERY
jgi:hypothetical protein